ncbi:hypothetical protein MVES1_001389 [Malassezia vespertilionis]|uniref:uncharacterized protein n=1 Tax=Malassezia vespertilionis TaxID=2020962 RepID=UPI0024B12750|nr:uncharacterized protein MVES1_001389 [Malassezia vespertilionis]WFD06051.1 hypothetical protein MVES1_001389 [Malassezia vespertilionis]
MGIEPCVSVLADTLHPYPATKLGFQPSTLFGKEHGSASAYDKHRSYGWQGSDASLSRASSQSSASSASQADTSEFVSDASDAYPDTELLASSAECLHIWELTRNDAMDEMHQEYEGMSLSSSKRRTPPFALKEKCALAHAKNSSSPPAPLTSFSWNAPSPNLIVTSSIDTTCTIWDLNSRVALTQLIAHDREVYDVDWCPGSADVFASVGADGSVRVFDLRNLEHSTIIYETNLHNEHDSTTYTSSSTAVPLLRIAFNPWDANYLATFHIESDTVQILDVRAPGSPILELRGHSGAVNSIAWGPPSQMQGRNGPSKGMVCTGGDDAQCLVYDMASTTLRSASAQGRRSRNGHGGSPAAGAPDALRIGAEVPVLAYTAPSMVNNVTWLRSPLSSRRTTHGKHHSFYRNLLPEWSDYTSPAAQGTGNADWLALCAGRAVKMLRV